FFTNVSHDLRTPLTLIADPVGQLAKADNLTPRQHTLMQLASKNVKRLQRLINQILDIRKYDNGQLRLNLVNINLASAMKEWTAPFADMAARRHIRFSTSIPQKQEIVLAIDVEKTERILFNLLSNAFKFTPENGCIGVALESDGDNAVISVSDTGIGIPTEDINNIFERFFKTDKINPNGSGIGLALSKIFIDMHGGSISVESAEGMGTKFTVKFPLRQVSDMDVVQPVYGDIDVSEIDETEDDVVEVAEDTPTILVVDDNKEMGILVKSVLSDSYTVISASSGAQAIRLATRYVPDLIICDVMMPGMSGYDVCKSIKKEPLTSHIPVLLLTACTRDEQRIEGYECGADGYMSKPFDSEMLVARCKSLLDNRRRIYDNIGTRTEAIPSKPVTTGNSRTKIVNTVSVEDEFLQRFISIVEREMGNSELSVEGIADELGISRVQMYRKIKALTNYSVAEMIRNIRLKSAANMLKTSGSTVSEVAYAVGFSSPSYFSRCYKDYYGESPVDTQNRTSRIK
ncbi:MAG: response regulator, partial [Muribaculaceae bacterium]|nr:response regulator [Muribaculaceae bacterium]